LSATRKDYNTNERMIKMKIYYLDEYEGKKYKSLIPYSEIYDYINSVNLKEYKIGDIIPQGGYDPDPYIIGYEIVEIYNDLSFNQELCLVINYIWHE